MIYLKLVTFSVFVLSSFVEHINQLIIWLLDFFSFFYFYCSGSLPREPLPLSVTGRLPTPADLEAYALDQWEVRMPKLNSERVYHACLFFTFLYSIFTVFFFSSLNPVLAYIYRYIWFSISCWDYSASCCNWSIHPKSKKGQVLAPPWWRHFSVVFWVQGSI